MHRIAYHLPQFLDGFALRGDGVAESSGDITAVRLSPQTSKMISLIDGLSQRRRQAGKREEGGVVP